MCLFSLLRFSNHPPFFIFSDLIRAYALRSREIRAVFFNFLLSRFSDRGDVPLFPIFFSFLETLIFLGLGKFSCVFFSLPLFRSYSCTLAFTLFDFLSPPFLPLPDFVGDYRIVPGPHSPFSLAPPRVKKPSIFHPPRPRSVFFRASSTPPKTLL